jgi:hypothetical protein
MCIPQARLRDARAHSCARCVSVSAQAQLAACVRGQEQLCVPRIARVYASMTCARGLFSGSIVEATLRDTMQERWYWAAGATATVVAALPRDTPVYWVLVIRVHVCPREGTHVRTCTEHVYMCSSGGERVRTTSAPLACTKL